MDLNFKPSCKMYDEQIYPLLAQTMFFIDKPKGHALKFGHRLYTFRSDYGIQDTNVIKHLIFKEGDETSPLASVEVSKEGEANLSKFTLTHLRTNKYTTNNSCKATGENLFLKRINEIHKATAPEDPTFSRWQVGVLLVPEMDNQVFILLSRTQSKKKYIVPFSGPVKFITLIEMADQIKAIKDKKSKAQVTINAAGSVSLSRVSSNYLGHPGLEGHGVGTNKLVKLMPGIFKKAICSPL